MAFSPGDSISTAYFWDMGYLTQAQTHPACSHWFCHCNIPVTWDAMPALPELHLLVAALLIRRRSCLRWAVSQEQEPLPGCCGGTGLHCSLWQSGAGVTGCLPARGKVCPGQVVSMLEKNVFSRHFWMQGCLEVWNDRFSMKQRVKTSSLKKRKPPGLACSVQPLRRVSDASAWVGTSGACAENEDLSTGEIIWDPAAALIAHSANQRTLKHHRHSLLHWQPSWEEIRRALSAHLSLMKGERQYGNSLQIHQEKRELCGWKECAGTQVKSRYGACE